MATPPIFTLLLICCFCLKIVISATTNITTFLTDPETLLSSSATFKAGFFSPTNSTNRYVGIWYNIEESDAMEIVWVANRNNPINDSSGMLIISEDGNLQLSDGQNMIYWSSNVSHQANSTSVAHLLDTGNLVLVSSATGMIIWQSFEHMTNSLLPQTRIIIDLTIDNGLYEDEKPILRSWKSASDPSNGRFRIGMIPFPITEFVTRDGDKTYWLSGPWNGSLFLGVPYMSQNTFEISFDHLEDTLEILYSVANVSLLEHFVLNYDGNVVLKYWDDDDRRWRISWQSVQSECDIYGKCGPFGRCNPKDSPICNCLNGFEPMNVDEWSEGNWTSGCVRRTPLQCSNTGRKADGFWKLKHMKVPHYITFGRAADEDDCRRKCLETCSCLAYAYTVGIGCMIWDETLLMDIQVFSGDGADLFIRLAYSELGDTQHFINHLLLNSKF